MDFAIAVSYICCALYTAANFRRLAITCASCIGFLPKTDAAAAEASRAIYLVFAVCLTQGYGSFTAALQLFNAFQQRQANDSQGSKAVRKSFAIDSQRSKIVKENSAKESQMPSKSLVALKRVFREENALAYRSSCTQQKIHY